MAFLAVESISWSMFGNRNSSFGQTQLRFLKSTQHLIYPFFFFIGTILDNRCGFWMGLMKPMANSFCIFYYLFFYFGMKYSGKLSHELSLGIYVERVHYQSWV